jgi:hypothetical protein
VNIETMTPAERIKLLEALELSFGVVAVAHVDIEDARDRLQKLEPDAQRASIDSNSTRRPGDLRRGPTIRGGL